MHGVLDRILSEPGVELYVRHLAHPEARGRGVILLNSRSLCVESSMGIPMGGLSYADYLYSQGISVFMVDLRGYGSSSPIEEQLVEDRSQVRRPIRYEDYYTDLAAASEWARARLGAEPALTIVGFSLMATLAAIFADRRPDLVDHVVCINPNWLTPEGSPPRASGVFITDTQPQVPYVEVSMNSIRTRLEQAQQPGSNFIEPLWYEEAWRELRECHSTYDRERDTWRINKWDRASWTRLTSQPLKNIQADVLVIHSQYDAENPWFIVNAFMSSLATKKKYLRTLPFATHLCIWERARTTLYEWTAEFILL